jgi:hypothetical protein
MLGVAAVAEILAYYVPGVDNLLDALATPTAFVAGTVVSAAVITDLPPMVKWTAAVIAGGGNQAREHAEDFERWEIINYEGSLVDWSPNPDAVPAVAEAA